MLDLMFADKNYAIDVLRQCWYGMSVRERECLLLSVAGFTQNEIGDLLSITRSGVSRHFNAALRQISAKAEEIEREEPAVTGIGHLRGYQSVVTADGYEQATVSARPPVGGLIADIYGNRIE